MPTGDGALGRRDGGDGPRGGGRHGPSQAAPGLLLRGASLATLIPSIQQAQYSQGERTSPGASSLLTTDSPTSYHNEEDEEDEEAYDTMVEEQYGQMYIKATGSYAVQDKPEPVPLESHSCVFIHRKLVALPASLISQIGYHCHSKLYSEGAPARSWSWWQALASTPCVGN